jgi:hypothetical protein
MFISRCKCLNVYLPDPYLKAKLFFPGILHGCGTWLLTSSGIHGVSVFGETEVGGVFVCEIQGVVGLLRQLHKWEI